jgi:hypothetical protein
VFGLEHGPPASSPCSHLLLCPRFIETRGRWVVNGRRVDFRPLFAWRTTSG